MERCNMDRRKFLKTTGTFIAGATVARSALAHVATDAAAAQGRMVLPLVDFTIAAAVPEAV